ncbi:type II asparaginase [Flavivirga spongiicola]|uniref:Type II asparaginase n=1 Tax=Flavivirga spongiicola TaxID=421621 RepID=A0ABU7XVW3_9FLAO|nr:type II asparaginase [Flavivirga sp. MEBiC05379]MDO5979550.1 type II asparaginase [Flavivirga sp. MEBiC05379]
MKFLNIKMMAFLIAVTITAIGSAQDTDLPNVKILATGGTIAGSASSATSGSYAAGQVGIQTMINAVPGIEKLADVSGEQVANVGSQDMTIEIWLKLANRINELLASDDVDGIVVTHGTDTQEETAYFLSLVVKSDKPVVTTGSMRSSTSISAEGPLNLYNAVAIASNPEARGKGVMVSLNDQIHAARDVSKMNTTNVNSFQSPIKGMLGGVFYGRLGFFRTPNTKFGNTSKFSIMGVEALPRVDIIYAYADMSPDLIDMHVKAGAKGIVIAGVGNGNMTDAILNAAKKAYEDHGVIVVRSTRVATGWVLRDNEFKDDDYHTIVSNDLNPAKSRILLMLSLLKERSLFEIQDVFYNY